MSYDHEPEPLAPRWRPAKRPGKARGKIRQIENLKAAGDPNQPIRSRELSEDQIWQLRKENTGIDMAIAQALRSPKSMTVWSAHGQRSSLLVCVTVPDEPDEPRIAVDYVDGGTEWDRKQHLRKIIEELIASGKENGYDATRL